MQRIEVIPYENLEQRFELARLLELKKHKNKIKHVSDLGNCMLIEHFKNWDKALYRI